MRKYKPKNDNIDIENIELNKWYSITINPEKQYDKDGYLRYASIMKNMERVLNEYTSNIEYYLQVEISKLGRIHFHGWIKYRKDVDMVYICLIPKLISIATISIDYIDDSDIWYDYCMKQSKVLCNFRNQINYPPNLTIKDIMVSPFATSPKKAQQEILEYKDYSKEIDYDSDYIDEDYYDSEGDPIPPRKFN